MPCRPPTPALREGAAATHAAAPAEFPGAPPLPKSSNKFLYLFSFYSFFKLPFVLPPAAAIPFVPAQIVRKYNWKDEPYDMPFAFDQAFPETSSQDQVFSALGWKALKYAFSGYNASIFAYGQVRCTRVPPRRAGSNCGPRLRALAPSLLRAHTKCLRSCWSLLQWSSLFPPTADIVFQWKLLRPFVNNPPPPFAISCVHVAPLQTGSGKSHSMIGTENDPGLIRRIGDFLFDFIGRGEAELGLKYTTTVRAGSNTPPRRE